MEVNGCCQLSDYQHSSKDTFLFGNANIYTLGFPSHPYHNQRRFYLNKQA